MDQLQASDVAAPYAPVQTAFETALGSLTTTGAAFSATVAGREVVNLVAGQARPSQPWQVNTPAVLMSVTKGLAALCVAVLVDRGQLDTDALISDYWPEYAANGKHATTVRHVLTHQFGLLGFPDAAADLGWDGRGWDDLDLIAARLAAAPPSWEPGTRHGYHAVSYGWVLGELVRRVTGRSLGTFFRDEIAAPLALETAIGTGPDLAARVAVVDGSRLHDQPLLMRIALRAVLKRMRTPGNLLSLAYLGDGSRSIMEGVEELLARPAFLAAEVPSSNGVSSARDLARLFSVLALGGTLGEVRLLSQATVTQFATFALRDVDAVVTDTVRFPGAGLLHRKTAITRSLGYCLNEPLHRFGPTPSAYGMEGAGGQVVFCDPERQVSVAFVRSGLHHSPAPFPALVAALYNCLPS